VLQLLLNEIFSFGEESILQTLKLLTLAFYIGKDLEHSLQKVEATDAISTPTKSISQLYDKKNKKRVMREIMVMLISLLSDSILLIFVSIARYLESLWKECSGIARLVEISLSPHVILLWVYVEYRV